MPMVQTHAALRRYLHTLSWQELRWLQRSLDCVVAGNPRRRVTLITAIVAYADDVGLARDYARTLVQHGEILGYARGAR